jgi:hypothetical protein
MCTGFSRRVSVQDLRLSLRELISERSAQVCLPELYTMLTQFYRSMHTHVTPGQIVIRTRATITQQPERAATYEFNGDPSDKVVEEQKSNIE